MAIINQWVKYVDRTYEQIKANVLTKFGNLVPEITDHTESNPWVKGISIWSGIAEMIGYYLDNKAREVFLPTAKRFESAVKIARLFGYRVKGALAASADLTFSINAITGTNVVIPQGTLIKTDEGTEFRTTQSATILAGQTQIQVSAKQWTPVANQLLGTSDGSIDQVYELDENVVDNAITILVNLTSYAPVDTFAFSVPGDEHFVAGINENNKMEVKFGDDINAKIPPSAEDIVANYYTSLGANGNVGANTITNIIDNISTPSGITLSCTNILKASGGADAETLDRLRKLIPLSLRTKNRAVTDQDFIDIAELKSGVAKAGLDFECGRDVSVYIAPVGGGVASQQLIDDTVDWFETRRIITVKVRVLGAGELLIKIVANIEALPNYTNAQVLANVQDAINTFMSVDFQDINGKVVIGDVYQAIEGAEGVKNSRITLFSPVPYARPIDATTNILNWTRDVKPASTVNVKWAIRFIATNIFELKKNGSFIGNFAVNNTIAQPEIEFMVNGTYALNDEYEFVTYPYNDNRLILDEPSIPVTDNTVLNLTVTGGIQ